MRRLMWSTLAALAALPCLSDEPGVAELIRRLDAEEAEARDEAAAELRRRGAAAEPELRRALESESPEVRGRAARVLKDIAVDRVLEKLEAAELRKVWDRIEHGSPAERRFAIRDWVGACGRKPETVDALLELLTLDPGGPAGRAACEALNRLCAPRTTGVLEQRASGTTWNGTETVEAELKQVLEESYRASDAARARVSAVTVPAKNVVQPETHLTQIGRLCGWAEVVWRLDDADGLATIETPEESLAVWKPWWDATRKDRLALMDLGIAEAPRVAGLADEDLRPWLEALCSADARHARVARRVLREMTPEQEAKFRGLAKRPDAPAALRSFAARLELRALGRLSWTAGDRDDMRVWIASLDGSGARAVVPGEKTWWLSVPRLRGTTGFLYIGPFDGDHSLHRVDLSGLEAPKRIGDDGEMFVMSPDGARLLGWKDGVGGSLRVVNAATGASTPLADLPAKRAEWSPDATRVAVLDWNAQVLHLHDLVSGRTATCAGVPISNWDGWAPDGSSWAFNRLLERCTAPGVGGKRQIELADAKTGEARAAIGPVDTITLGRAAWSPDGKLLAAGWFERGEDPKTGDAVLALWDPATGKTRVERRRAAMTRHILGEASVLWSPDGASLLWRYDQDSPGLAFTPATGAWREARPARIGSVWIPGTDWILESRDGDIVVFHLFDDVEFNLTESGEDEHSPVFLYPLE